MKIAIAATGKTKESQVDPRFGRCQYFLIYDDKKDKLEAVDNIAGQAVRGAGVAAAQLLADKKVEAVIAGNFGPNAINVLNSSNIKIITVAFGTLVKKALEQYKKGKLKKNQ